MPSTIEDERAWRYAQWVQLVQHHTVEDIPPAALRTLGIYGGAQGIWVDKARTASLTPDAAGVTVSVLHTGRHYADDLGLDDVLYHYPHTSRPPGRDRAEIEATKAAQRLQLPIFVITPSPHSLSRRRVFLGWVENWNDESEIFLISFGDSPPTPPEDPKGAEAPFVLQVPRSVRKREVAARIGQQRFKFYVLQRYGAQCVVCNMAVPQVLQAAHIVSKLDKGSDDARNGLVLCGTHHLAFDAGLFSINPNTLEICCLPDGPDRAVLGLHRTDIQHLERKPSPEALRWVWERRQNGSAEGTGERE